MSDITYLAVQSVILLAYGCWVAYRIGYSRGQSSVWKKINVFKTWKEIK